MSRSAHVGAADQHGRRALRADSAVPSFAPPERPSGLVARLREWPRLEDGLCLLVASSPLSKAATNIALGFCVILFIRDWIIGSRRPRATPLDAAILTWVLVCLLSGLTSLDPLKSFRDLRSVGHWSVYYLLAWAVASGASLRRLENVWLAAGVATAIQALGQAAFGFDLRGRPSVVPTGFFGGHLELGHYMVILLGLAIARWSEASRGRDRAIILVGVLVCGAALVVSTGRGPWLAFLAVVACWAVIQGGRRAVEVLVLIGALQLVFLARQPEGLEGFYRSYVTFETAGPTPVAKEQVGSNVWRVVMWREGLRMFSLHPLTGTGVETTGRLSRDFRTPVPGLAVAHLHSNYVEILMTRGFFGLAAFFFLLITSANVVGRTFARSAADGGGAARFAALAAIVAHVVHGLTHFTVGSSWIQIGFYVALGLGIGTILRQAEARSREPAFRVDPVAIGWGIVTVGATILVSPLLAMHPWLVTAAVVTALVDLGVRAAIGGGNAVGGALFAALAFVGTASLVLLLLSADTRDLGVRVILAASVPFVLGYASERLFSALRSVPSTS